MSAALSHGFKDYYIWVSSSNSERNYIFSLPEGRWLNGNTASTVATMLQHIMNIQTYNAERVGTARHLKLHADSCSDQSTNKFLWGDYVGRYCVAWTIK